MFYGWLVVAASFAVALTLGESFWAFGVFFKPLEAEFGWSRTTVSSAYTAFLIGFSISAVTSGRLADRWNPRPILMVTAVVAGLGISLCSRVYSINQLIIFLSLAGLGSGATWSVPTSTVQRWFYKRERAGLALAIVVTGVGVGGAIFAPLVNYFVLSYGWRNAFLIMGIIFFVIIAAASLVIRPSPTSAGPKIEGASPKSAAPEGWTTGKAIITPAFLSITFVLCAGLLAFGTLSVHLVPYAIDSGVSPTAAAAALGLIGAFSITGRLASAFLSDRIGWQKVLAFALFGMGLSVTWLLFMKAQWMLYGFVFFYGTCHGLRIPSQVGMLSDFFGTRSLGELIGISGALAQLVGAFAPYFTGFIFDTTGSYFIAFVIVMVFLVAGGAVALTVKQPMLAPG